MNSPPSRRYFFSWRDPNLQGVEEDWLGVRNYCRQRCMDAVSLETSPKNEWIKQRIVDGKVSFAGDQLGFGVTSHDQSHDHERARPIPSTICKFATILAR